MLKLIIILVLLIYVLNKISVIFLGSGSRMQQPPRYRQEAQDGKIHVDRMPGKTGKKSDFKGGEYIDYEEVK